MTNVRKTHVDLTNSWRTLTALMLTAIVIAGIAATTAAQAQTYTDLFDFDSTHGWYSRNPELLAQGPDGLLYGTTSGGGLHQSGTAFSTTPDGDLTVLYNFDGIHGAGPYCGFTLGIDNYFYGATGGGTYGYGTIFKITRGGKLTTLYNLTATDGAIPNAPPIQAADGNFYGLTAEGGVDGKAYKITPSGEFTVLGTIPGVSVAPLMQASDGNFYAGTYVGDPKLGCATSGCVFKLTPQGVISVIYNFDGTHGAGVYPPLVQGNDGYLYGNTISGGKYGQGVIFRLTAGGLTVLHDFGDTPGDGAQPVAGMILAVNGNFYGVTTAGGTVGAGIIFQISPSGAYSILYNFDGTNGANPWPTPVQHTNGKIYGITYDGGNFGGGVLYSFDYGLAPFIKLVSQTGRIGKAVEILGQGFTGATSVAFNGVAASFTIKSDTFLSATIPTGATTGFVTVTTLTGTLSSSQKFLVKP